MRLYTTHMRGEKYLGNSESKELHDLDKVKQQCNIDNIVNSGNEIPFSTLKEALSEGFIQCSHCLNQINDQSLKTDYLLNNNL
ncbi:MAG: hypothetical protein P4L45_16675 [Ignavibacteriaceae bacterium]|nr:hypothetical protein [Ignavibacteriaceae bacterium]